MPFTWAGTRPQITIWMGDDILLAMQWREEDEFGEG